MADDLGDDWWNDEPVSGDEEGSDSAKDEQNPVDIQPSHMQSGKESVSSKPSHHESRKTLQDAKAQSLISQTEKESSNEPKKKKRRKKKKLSQHLADTVQKPGTPKDMMSAVHQHYQGKLSAIEVQELQLSDSSFLPSNTRNDSLSTYLKSCIPKWNKLVVKNKPAKPRTCLLLMVTVSAKRAVDLNRQAAEFKGQCVSAKLFAKHLKIQEQVKLLNKGGAHFAVGTPNRISSLIQSDALCQEETHFVILDWNWRDVKLRRMVDVPEVRKDLFELMRKYVVPAARTSDNLKIGLF